MTPAFQILPCHKLRETDPHALLTREWLVTNGLGGYASGTLAGVCTRRYHSLLVAALAAPAGRMVMFNHLSEELKLDHGATHLATIELSDAPFDPSVAALTEFRLESGLPIWKFELGAVQLEKRVLLPHLQNTVYVSYRLLAAPCAVRVRLRPSFHFRPHAASVSSETAPQYEVAALRQGFEVRSDVAPPLRMCCYGSRSSLVLDGGQIRRVNYRLEQERGYESQGTLWSPGYFRIDLAPGEEATLVASAEDWDVIHGIDPATAAQAELSRRERLVEQASPSLRQGAGADLVLAADQFIIRPITRIADAALAHARGEEAHTVIAGYHWFTDWGRDTMISLEGLTLATGRHNEAKDLLLTFSRYVKDGLIPNHFPEGENEGLYHTADATLWYFHAIERYVRATGDRDMIPHLFPMLRGIVDHHLRGTRFGIQVDPADGLLSQGQEGYQLTWMDAKVGDWVVTPRRGKAVEINALWYNALRLMQQWSRDAQDENGAAAFARHAEQTRSSFNRRFWNNEANYLYDVIDGEQGNDAAFRPNQLFAISLDYPVLDPERWTAVLEQVTSRLLTPFGLRSLAPGHPDYKPTYYGDLRSRDAAYHQGTGWAWLIGPYIDAWLRVYPEKTDKAHGFLGGFFAHLSEACVGSISEVFDAEAPYFPRGCIAQAWSVAEVLRSWVKTSASNGHRP